MTIFLIKAGREFEINIQNKDGHIQLLEERIDSLKLQIKELKESKVNDLEMFTKTKEDELRKVEDRVRRIMQNKDITIQETQGRLMEAQAKINALEKMMEKQRKELFDEA